MRYSHQEESVSTKSSTETPRDMAEQTSTLKMAFLYLLVSCLTLAESSRLLGLELGDEYDQDFEKRSVFINPAAYQGIGRQITQYSPQMPSMLLLLLADGQGDQLSTSEQKRGQKGNPSRYLARVG